MKKKFIAKLLVLCMVLTMLPMAALAVETSPWTLSETGMVYELTADTIPEAVAPMGNIANFKVYGISSDTTVSAGIVNIQGANLTIENVKLTATGAGIKFGVGGSSTLTLMGVTCASPISLSLGTVSAVQSKKHANPNGAAITINGGQYTGGMTVEAGTAAAITGDTSFGTAGLTVNGTVTVSGENVKVTGPVSVASTGTFNTATDTTVTGIVTIVPGATTNVPASQVTVSGGYKVTFNAGYGTINGTNLYAVAVAAGGTVDAPQLTEPSNYIFRGWYQQTDAATVSSTRYDFSTGITGDVTLVAKWESVGGGSGSGSGSGGLGSLTTGVRRSITVGAVENGRVVVSPSTAAQGTRVIVTATPDAGYHVASVAVADATGASVHVSKLSATRYTFAMPNSAVSVTVTFAEGAEEDNNTTDMPFVDVPAGQYYTEAVKWAVENEITTGRTETTFAPMDTCTRAQMVTFLWRLAGKPEPTGTANSFTDLVEGEYYVKAVQWAVENGITTGTTDTTFSPNDTVTRAQAVTFLYRYDGETEPTSTSAFTDLVADEYYVNAVNWGAGRGVVMGTSETEFSPDGACLRGMIVTYMYRYVVG